MKTAREVLMELEALSEEIGEDLDELYDRFTDEYSDEVLHAEETMSIQHMLYDEVADDFPAQLFRTLH